MKLRPYGLYFEGGRTPPRQRASDYSNERYDGIRCGYDYRRNPVVVMRSRRSDPLRWKVMYGFSTVFFHTFREAMDFCNGRNMEMYTESGKHDHD